MFGSEFRESYILFCFEVKKKIFPEYIPVGTIVPATKKKVNRNIPEIPEWVLTEMRELGAHVDPVLYPNELFLATCQFFSYPVKPKPGRIYAQLIKQCTTEHYTYCFAIPWLKRGGADLVSLKHIEFASKQPNSKVLVLLTEHGESPWLKKIPKDVDILLSHGPAYGYNDTITHDYSNNSKWDDPHVGSKSLLDRIKEVKIKWLLSGHIHSASHNVEKLYYSMDDITNYTNCVNVSLLDENYDPRYVPFEFSIIKED
jgi:hypothetical protein